MKHLFIISCLFFATCSFAQNNQNTSPESFEIAENNNPEKLVFYVHSISKANMENYRLKEKRVTLDFKNGFKCILLSAKELFIKGLINDVNTYPEAFAPNFSLPVFEVNDNGWITAGYSYRIK